MVKGCRIDTGSCEKPFSPKTLGTRVSCKTGTGMRLDGYRARQSLVGLSARCANSYILQVQHIIQYICAAGCRNLHSVHSVQLNSV